MPTFYVYFWLRDDGTPYYVGKGHHGKNSRAFSGHRHNVKCPKEAWRIVVHDYDSEEEAFDIEKFFITFYGRKDLGTGCLRNKTDGGDGPSGLIIPAHTRAAVAEANRRRVWTPEARQRWGLLRRGANHPNFGKPLPQATRDAIRRAKLGKALPLSTRIAMSLTKRRNDAQARLLLPS